MNVLMPIPATDFDPTETAVPWHVMSDRGHNVVFATPGGQTAAADVRMVEGKGLGPWKPLLQAAPRARQLYRTMEKSAAFRQPVAWADVQAEDYGLLLLPGGHAAGMRPYLESKKLQHVAASFIERDAPLAAICHGVVLLARARRADGSSVLEGRRVTALLESQEMVAYTLTRLWLGSYYRTYPQTVEAEVRQAVGADGSFERGPLPTLRDRPGRLSRGFVVRDANLITARWPGDAFRFADEVSKMLR